MDAYMLFKSLLASPTALKRARLRYCPTAIEATDAINKIVYPVVGFDMDWKHNYRLLSDEATIPQAKPCHLDQEGVTTGRMLHIRCHCGPLARSESGRAMGPAILRSRMRLPTLFRTLIRISLRFSLNFQPNSRSRLARGNCRGK